jgi:hypothetical protein
MSPLSAARSLSSFLASSRRHLALDALRRATAHLRVGHSGHEAGGRGRLGAGARAGGGVAQGRTGGGSSLRRLFALRRETVLVENGVHLLREATAGAPPCLLLHRRSKSQPGSQCNPGTGAAQQRRRGVCG